jgi:hypothetical protein
VLEVCAQEKEEQAPSEKLDPSLHLPCERNIAQCGHESRIGVWGALVPEDDAEAKGSGEA